MVPDGSVVRKSRRPPVRLPSDSAVSQAHHRPESTRHAAAASITDRNLGVENATRRLPAGGPAARIRETSIGVENATRSMPGGPAARIRERDLSAKTVEDRKSVSMGN